jgi:hypothetical protein
VQAQDLSLLFSLIAVVVAVYGIYERRLAATRAERLRLGVIADDLEKIKLELARESRSGQPAGDHIEALHGRTELLAQQGLSLLREHEISANSSECRAIAFALDETGFADNADEIWRLANKKADSEGDVQALFATRGYGFFLLRQGRRDEAHKTLNSGLSRISTTDNTGRYWHAETFTHWAAWEPDSDTVKTLLDRVKRLYDECESPPAKARIGSLFHDPSALGGPSKIQRDENDR